MSDIQRFDVGARMSDMAVHNGVAYLAGQVAADATLDAQGQTADVLAQIDAMLEHHGTDKTRLLQATIWVKHIKDRGAMNEVWTPWLPKDGAPVRACVQAEMAAPEILVEIMVTACK